MIKDGDIVVTDDLCIGKFVVSQITIRTTGEDEEHNYDIGIWEEYKVQWTDGSSNKFKSMEEAQCELRKATKQERFLYEMTKSSTCLLNSYGQVDL